MKKIIYTFLLVILALSTSCTHTDGDIGPWFGSWYLEEILVNGEKESSYQKDIMISFQGDMFKFGYIDRAEIYGLWDYAGEILTLDASYNAGNGAGIDYLFNPFPVAMHFPADIDQVQITVTKIENSNMQWQYIDQNGRLLTYNFKKYP